MSASTANTQAHPSTSSTSSSSSSSSSTTTPPPSPPPPHKSLLLRLRGWWQNRPRRHTSSAATNEDDESAVWSSLGYSLSDRIGVGEFATVHRAVRREDELTVAVKIFKLDTLANSSLSRIEREAELIKLAAPHRNLVGFVELIRPARRLNVRAIVMEFVDGCDLLALMRSRDAVVFSEREARDLFSQLLSAVAHLHAAGIVHRDIKLENVLVGRADNVVKLCDFGFARRVNSPEHTMTTLCGSPTFLAPELAKRREYTLAVDAWACGVVLFIMLAGAPPFLARSETALLRLIARGSFQFDADDWSTISDAAKRLVSSLLTVDVRERATPMSALGHEWFAM